ncbi:MAG: flavoprotein, partial [Micromonosporaceae bacterium]
VLVCGAAAARDVSNLVELALQAQWDVAVIASPDGLKFIDADALRKQTGFPVRSHYKDPADPDILPPPDAMVVAPATTNTINKWAAGISDTLVLGLLVEGLGKGLPIVAAPFTNAAQAAHPAFSDSVDKLRRWGVILLWGDEFYRTHPVGAGDANVKKFPWPLIWRALRERMSAGSASGERLGGGTR